MSANALMQIAFMGSRIVGPAAAGALVARFGPSVCYAIDVVSFLASAALIGSVAIMRAGVARGAADSSSNRIHAIWLDMVAGDALHRPSRALSVLRARDGGRPVHDRLLRSADLDLRARYAARERRTVRLRQRHGRRRAARRHAGRSACSRAWRHDTGSCCRGSPGIGAGVLLLGAVPHIAATLAATFTIGFAFAAIMVPAQTLIQRETPHDMLGRVGEHQRVGDLPRRRSSAWRCPASSRSSSACGRCSSCARRSRWRSPRAGACSSPGRPIGPSRDGDAMNGLIQDLRYAVRAFARNPGFTAAALLSLAIGIGANSAIFSVASALLLRPLPYQDADRLAHSLEPLAGTRHRRRLVLDRAVLRHQAAASAASSRSRLPSAATTT